MSNLPLPMLLNGAFYLIVLVICLVLGALTLNNLPMNMPPGFAARLKQYATQNTAKTEANAKFPELELPIVSANPKDLLTQIERAMTILGWEVSQIDQEKLTIEAVVTTALFRFKDDVTVELKRENHQVALFITSTSRVGKGDLGANTRHILDLLNTLDKQIDIEVPSF